MEGLGWMNYEVEAPGGISQQHMIPENDLKPHRLMEGCDCCPVEDDEAPDFWQHNSWDHREDYEDGRRLH